MYFLDFFSRMQPVYVVDVAGAIVAALKDDGSSMGKTYELGGPDVFTVRELVYTLNFVLYKMFQLLGLQLIFFICTGRTHV